MKIYSVYIKPKASDPLAGVRFLEEGFNWWAFLFAPLWALYHHMWLVAGLSFMVAAVSVNAAMEGNMSFQILEFGWYLAVGMFGNDWLVEKLKKRGYRWQDVVAGRNLDEAQLRFLERSSAVFQGRHNKPQPQPDFAASVVPV